MTTEKESWVSQIRKGVVEIAVLGMLAREEMYASEIVEGLASRPELAITAGTVYPLLSRLRKSGVVESVWRESPVGPPRKYYKLTKPGRQELREMDAAWRRVSVDLNELLDGVERDAGS